MELKTKLFEELVRKGHIERLDGRKVFDVADRCFLYESDNLAEAFLKLRAHPRYKATIINIEIELLEEFARRFINVIGDKPCNVIDMGCGDGKKAKAFFGALEGVGKIRYCPTSPNDMLRNLATKNVKESNFENVVEYKPLSKCMKLIDMIFKEVRDDKYEKNVILLMGSLLASFDIHEYLFEISKLMRKGDCLLIGNAIRTGDRFTNIQNYRHPLFYEWLKHIVFEMGFEENEVEFGGRFENGRVEGYFEVKEDKVLTHEGKDYVFKRGDEIIVGILYKYFAKELEEYCKMYFRDVELVKDKDEEQALVCCIKS
jgi:uncharacterized SAM-dependent methyltransferase